MGERPQYRLVHEEEGKNGSREGDRRGMRKRRKKKGETRKRGTEMERGG